MHEHHEERGPERVHTENVVLDIGGEVAALIIYAGRDWRGRKVELSLRTHGAPRVHNQVHEWGFNGQTLFAAVHPPPIS